MSTPREAAYDEHISPLMTRVIALCKEHKIPALICFDISGEDEEQEGSETLRCTTFVHGPDWAPDPTFTRALSILRPDPPVVMAFTITTTPKGGAR